MKYIQKNIKNEPDTLKAYRSTPNATYTGFADTRQLLKTALCKEQGYICCYCMRRIEPKQGRSSSALLPSGCFLFEKEITFCQFINEHIQATDKSGAVH